MNARTNSVSVTGNLAGLNGFLPQQTVSAAARQTHCFYLALLLGWLCLAPTLSGTPLKHCYAYGLAAFGVAWCAATVGTTNQLGRRLLRPEHWMLTFALGGMVLSAVMTPYPTRAGDVFQLGRECYQVFVFGFLSIFISRMSDKELDVTIHRFVVAFLLGAFVLFLLQNYSQKMFDILLEYYYIESSSESAGYMRARPGLTFGNPNGIGIAICFVAILGLTQRGLSLSWAACIVAIGAAEILWTGSRTAVFTFVVSMGVILAVNFFRMLTGLLLLAVIAIFVVPFFADDQTMEWVATMSNRLTNERGSINERYQIWDDLLVNSEWRFYPLLGLGPSTEHLVVADSGYVLSLYRYGYLGLAHYVLWPAGLIVMALYALTRSHRREQSQRLLVATISFLVCSYAMAPLSDPRLCTLYLFIVATSLHVGRECRE